MLRQSHGCNLYVVENKEFKHVKPELYARLTTACRGDSLEYMGSTMQFAQNCLKDRLS